MIKLTLLVVLIGVLHNNLTQADCPQSSVTTASGTHAPTGQICPGDLIFEDNFDNLDLRKWSHEKTLGGGGNWEFEWYTNNRTISYVEDGNFVIKPRLLADQNGEAFLYSGQLDINGGSPADECTNPQWYGCSRTGTADNALNPVISARVRTLYSFTFKYGRLEIRAKLPRGDWLWPALWLLPADNQYSTWPASGEIDMIEGRGNRDYTDGGKQIGSQLVSSTLHWGPDWSRDEYLRTHAEKENPAGYDSDFHTYQMEWTPDHLQFAVDNEVYGTMAPPEGGFWNWGDFQQSGLLNPWRGASKMAPFDQEFYIIMNLACGGVNGYFPDSGNNANGQKPWSNNSPRASSDFWEGRNQWLPTWNQGTDDQTMKVDYVRVWAL